MATLIQRVDGTDATVRGPLNRPPIEAREGASHGSPERVPGAIFRVLAALYLRCHPDESRGALARELGRRLASGGIHYDLRTLRRQLTGAVSTVPPEVEAAMRQILRERDGLAREEELERALAASGIEIPPGDRASAYVMVERILPMVRLWLHLNPGQSKRFLASRLANDLGRKGSRSTIDSLQSVLAGRKRRVRRAVHRVLLGCLAELGLTSEEEANVTVRHAVVGSAPANCLRLWGVCVAVRRTRVGGRPRPFPRFGGRGASPGGHAVVSFFTPTA